MPDITQTVKSDVMTNDELSDRYLTFCLKSVFYGIDLKYVTEITEIQIITRVPNTPEYIKGVINLRGKIVPVVDALSKLKQKTREYDGRTCIIVLNMDGTQVGLIVDSVSDVVTVRSGDLTEPPVKKGAKSNQNKYLKSLANIDGRVILNIDCNKLLNDDYV